MSLRFADYLEGIPPEEYERTIRCIVKVRRIVVMGYPVMSPSLKMERDYLTMTLSIRLGTEVRIS
jgi:hypothetical protein